MVLIEERREKGRGRRACASNAHVLFLHSAAAMDHEAVGSNKDPEYVSVQKNTTRGLLGSKGEFLYPGGS